MHIFLEIAASLGRAYRCQIFDGRLQQLGDVLLNLLAQPGLMQGCEKLRVFDMGESATQRTFHNVVVNHCVPLLEREILAGKRRSAPKPASLPLERCETVSTVTRVAGDGDAGHR
jgi:hypothetical protein